MLLINCKVELSLTCNANCVLSNLVGNSTFIIADVKRYVPVVTLSTENNAKLSNYWRKDLKNQFIGTNTK